MPGTQAEYDRALASLRIRPRNTSFGIQAERARIVAFLNYLGRPPHAAEAAALTATPNAQKDIDLERQQHALKRRLEALRVGIVREARAAHSAPALPTAAPGNTAASFPPLASGLSSPLAAPLAAASGALGLGPLAAVAGLLLFLWLRRK